MPESMARAEQIRAVSVESASRAVGAAALAGLPVADELAAYVIAMAEKLETYISEGSSGA